MKISPSPNWRMPGSPLETTSETRLACVNGLTATASAIAWSLTTDELVDAAHHMLNAGYKPIFRESRHRLPGQHVQVDHSRAARARWLCLADDQRPALSRIHPRRRYSAEGLCRS